MEGKGRGHKHKHTNTDTDTHLLPHPPPPPCVQTDFGQHACRVDGTKQRCRRSRHCIIIITIIIALLLLLACFIHTSTNLIILILVLVHNRPFFFACARKWRARGVRAMWCKKSNKGGGAANNTTGRVQIPTHTHTHTLLCRADQVCEQLQCQPLRPDCALQRLQLPLFVWRGFDT